MTDAPLAGDGPQRRSPRLGPRGWGLLVTLGSLAVVAAGTVAAEASHRQIERQLLDERAGEAGAVLDAIIRTATSRLSAAAEVAEVSDADASSFVAAMTPAIGVQFASAALYPLAGGEPVAVAGEPPVLATYPDRAAAMTAAASERNGLVVVDLVDVPERRLGYAYTSSTAGPRYIAYAEAALQPLPTTVEPGSPFADLDFVLYLGAGEDTSDVLAATREDLPVTGDRSVIDVPVGDTEIRLVATTRTDMAGALPATLPWIVAVVGSLMAIAAGVVTDRLLRRQRDTERLATRVAGLYAAHRQRSETLQRSLLPRALPAPPGMEVTGRYWPAGGDIEIGGDFYDLLELEEMCWALVIGDVCGHGVEAAALTGVTRHTIRAAARHVTSPVEVLEWTHDAVKSYSGDTYCTVCFGFLSIDDGGGARFEMALAGHPGPLLCHADGTVDVLGRSGTLLGLIDPSLTAMTYDLHPGDTLLLYTDGLTDAPGDHALALEDLRDVVRTHAGADPETVADAIHDALDARRPNGASDDTALLLLHLKPA